MQHGAQVFNYDGFSVSLFYADICAEHRSSVLLMFWSSLTK